MRTVHFAVGNACNNGCRGCLWTRSLDLMTPIDSTPSEDVRGRGVRLAGREPTMRQDLPEVVSALSAAGAAGIEIETNGRMLGYASYVRKLRDGGVTRLVIKLFGADEESWDAHTRVPGSCAQTLRGVEVVRRVAPRIDLVALLVPRREAGGIGEMVAFARRHGFEHARIELRLAKLDLAALPSLAEEVRGLLAQPPAGMRIEVNTS